MFLGYTVSHKQTVTNHNPGWLEHSSFQETFHHRALQTTLFKGSIRKDIPVRDQMENRHSVVTSAETGNEDMQTWDWSSLYSMEER
jgi:hypothetical protein